MGFHTVNTKKSYFEFLCGYKCFIITIIIIISCINNVSFSQGRRELGVYQDYKYELNDSLRRKIEDSLGISLDTTRLQPVDSTARLKYFQYIPKYSFGTTVKEKKHPLLLDNSSYVEYKVTFSDSDKVVIRQLFNGEEIKAPLVITLDEYLENLSDYNESKIFSEIFTEKFKGISTDDLTRLFEKFTDITVPLPFKSETIFGPPTFNLRLNGAIDITASYQNVKSDQAAVSFLSNTQNNINFKQEVQVTAKGSIGDKLTIDADWNTQRTFDFENQLKLKYTGYPDEVIQKIEAGNVSLDTKSNLIQSTQALFGVRGEFKLGPLSLISVVSQKKSKQEEKDYTGGAQEQNFNIDVWNYSDSHYFIDTLYKRSFIEVYNDSLGGNYSQFVYENRIKITDPDFEVWVQCQDEERNKRYAVAWAQLYPRPAAGYDDSLKQTTQDPGRRFFGFFRKLNETEYFVDAFAGFIGLRISIPENYHVGVTYSSFNNSKYGKGQTESGSNDTLILKMIKTANPDPDQTPLAWELKMKNIYRLPVSKVVEDGFKLEALVNNNNVYEPNISIGGVSKNLSQILLIDRYTSGTRRGPPDNIFDYIPGLTINTETGDIIFPTLRPFFDNMKNAGADSTLQYGEIYTQKKILAQTSPKASYYTLKGSAKGEAGISNTISLGLNVVQGSVKIFKGSEQLQENIDYSVDYSSGTVVIRNAAALLAKDLKIKYETNDLFTLASKTFLGLRGDYKISEKTNLGFTFANLIQETLNDKVRIGEEPTNNSMFGLDFSTELNSNFLTKAINFLPGYNTKEESVFSFKGEFAYINPDPNTKKSGIPQDNNEAIAYIDDMEGAKKLVSIGTAFSTWSISSCPLDTTIGSNDSVRHDRRASLKWYNIPNAVEIKQIYPLRDVQAGQDRITPFYLIFDPSERGIYNYNDINFDTVNKSNNWNGIMKYLNTTSTDLTNENINYIEFNMKVENVSNTNLSQAKMYIDLGAVISEDAIPNGVLDTEDKLNRNGILEEQEDIGLDYLTNVQEREKYRLRNNGLDPPSATFNDPALDDNDNTAGLINYDKLNGTENNRNVEGFRRPDSEDLNRNGAPDFVNSYFEYEISLDTTDNNRISGRGAPGSGWFQYRIPLSEFTKNINNATLTRVEYARVWIKGVDGKVQLLLVDFNLVGNQWFKPNKTDTTYNISVVSIEENPQIYQSPVANDILRQTIRNQNGVNTKSNEQSLSLSFNNLLNGQQKVAIKDYRSQTLDLFNYKTIKLFVNGDPSLNYTNDKIYDATMIVRFGSDSLNYYEYRAPIHPDVRPGQPWNPLNEVNIVFSDLTALKISRDSVNQVIDVPVPNGPPGSYYRIRGNPALNIIREFVLGVEKNRTGLNATLSGSVWFNEIRVLKVNDDNGFAYNVNSSVKVADFGTFSFNMSKIDPNFHSLDTRAGSRNTGQIWDFSASVNVHKILNNALVSFLSPEWKDFLNIPVTYRHSENLTNPKYYPGTDIEIDKAAQERYKQVLLKTKDETLAQKSSEDLRKEAQTLIVRNEISITGMTLKFPGTNYFVRTILNAFSFNFSGSYGSQRDVTYERKDDFSVNGSINFNTDFQLSDILRVNIGKLLPLGEQYKDAKLYFFAPFFPLIPLFSSNFNGSIDMNRSRNESKQRRFEDDDPTSRLFRANRGFGFNWKFIENWLVDLTGTYNFKIGSDLTQLETYRDSLSTQRPESEILKDIFFNNGLVNFGNDLDFTQTTTFNPKFNIPVFNKFLDVNMSYNVTYGWTNPNTTINTGYNVGFSNTFNTGATVKFSEVLTLIGINKNPSNFRKYLSGAGINKTTDDKPGFGDILKIFGTFIPDLLNLTFNQTNTVANPGVTGRPGFGNFWSVLSAKEEFGPSRMYQLGFSMDPGKRAPGLNITDIYNLSNNLTVNATITPIIPQSIRMNLSFKNLWGFNNTGTFITNQQGIAEQFLNRSSSKTTGYSMFFSGDVEKLRYEATTDPNQNAKNFAETFKNDIASIPFPNWSLSISGLEKLPLFSEFASSVTFENTFTSEYSESRSTDINNNELVQRQSVTESFNPLIGINVTFKELMGGSLTASLRINSSKSNILTPSSNLIQTTITSDWSLTANYAKSGFDIPFFGLSLKNDIAFSLTVSQNENDPKDFRFDPGNNTPSLVPGIGSTVFTFNPSIQYSLSAKVQMQLFYKYIRTEPTGGGVTVVPRTSNEGGLNVRISIQ